jgi:hypothetical protein
LRSLNIQKQPFEESQVKEQKFDELSENKTITDYPEEIEYIRWFHKYHKELQKKGRKSII